MRVFEQQTNSAYVLTNQLSHRDYLEIGTNVLKPDQFAFSLAMEDGWLAVGAPRDDESSTDAGAVYVYRRTVLTNGEISYLETQKIRSPEPVSSGHFGASLAMTTNRLIVGSPGFEEAGKVAAGRVYVYELSGTNWVCIGAMRRPPNASVEFGIEVAANERWMAAGARFSSASSNLTDRVTVLPHLSAYDLWTGFHGLDGLVAEPSSDEDGDGASNLAEYAYNLNPKVADALLLDPESGTSGLPSVRWIRREGDSILELAYMRRLNSSLMGIAYTIERSADLHSWNPAVADLDHSVAVSPEWERVRLEFPIQGSESKGFYRVRVVKEFLSTAE